MTTFIRAIGVYLPSARIDNLDRAAGFGASEAFVREKLGPLQLAIKAPEEETSDLAVQAVRNIDAPDFDLAAVDGLIVCTQNPDGHGLPHTSAIVHAKLGLSGECAAFDISLGCSGFVYGLALARSFAQTYGLRNVLLVTADPYSKVVEAGDRETAMLFGDGATATWLARHGGGGEWAIGPAKFATSGKGARYLHVNDEGHLRMKGREIFTFAAVEAPKQIDALLVQEGLGRGDIDCYLLHQGSRYIVDTIRDRMGLAPDRVPVELTDYGNTISSSIPMLLANRLSDPDLRKLVLCGFGVGLSMASMILERK